MISELETLHALLKAKDPKAWFGQWSELSDVGYKLEGFETVARVEGEDRRWSRRITVITRGPSGKFYSWDYEHGLTESQESDYHGDAPVEVEPHTRPVVVTDWVPVTV